MVTSPPHTWQDNWRAPPIPKLTMEHPYMLSRPMLACADGSFLPLIAKYDAVAHAQVFELDANLCRDVQLVVRRQVSPPKVHAGLASTPSSQVIGQGGGDRGVCGYAGGLNEQGQPMDYQARINAIVAENLQREQCASMHSNAIPPPQQHTRTSSSTTTTNPADINDNKQYCTYWIRTGECDYLQQGCRYKHEMPSLEKLKDIGFTKGFPRWWQEKVQYARPAVVVGANGAGVEKARMKHDAGAFRRMVDAHLAKHGEKPREDKSKMGSGSSVGRASGSESEASLRAAVPAVRSRVVSTHPKPAAEVDVPQKVATTSLNTPAKPVSILSKPKPRQPADLLDLISDSESDSLQPALKAPQNSPESQRVLRQGRFVPHNEPIRTSASITPPPRTILRSTSPLLLETRTAVDDFATDAKKLANVVAGLAPKLFPVGYQGKEWSSAKQPTEKGSKACPATETEINRIEELEAELAKLKPSTFLRTEVTKADTGLAKSRYAVRTEKVKMSPAAIISPNGRTKRRNRAARSPPLPTKKVVSAKALRGLQESRERHEKLKAKESSSEKQVEQVSKPVVAEVKPSTLPG